jgi:hypothetical protein
MNYFFGIKNGVFKSEITVPRFQNKGKTDLKYNLYQIKINSSKWVLEKLNNCELNRDFYLIKDDQLDNDKIFFLATENETKKFDNNTIIDFNNFTDTWPAYRANLKIYISNGGFSSYQSEYPFEMILKKGSLLTPTSVIFNKHVDKNYLIVRNIYKNPTQEKFFAYFVDIKNKKIIEKFEMLSNYSNFLTINKLLIKPEIYMMTDKFLGIPMFLSEDNNHLSFEHTHPPHTYFMSNNKFKKVSELKKEIYEIIN